jgi:hypothetical protein
MNFKNEYPEYGAIAEHIRRANVAKSFAVAHGLATLVFGAMRLVKRLAAPRRLQQREA